ncbi:unnamed protein product [Agarophyton chilense]
MPVEAVQVRLMGACNLPAVNRAARTSDPYAVLHIVRTRETLTSHYCLNNINPTWYECFLFHDVNPSDVLAISLFDKNHVKSDVPIGTAFISIGHALSHATAVVSQAAFEASQTASFANAPHPSHASVPFHVPLESIPPPPNPSSSILHSSIPPSYYPPPDSPPYSATTSHDTPRSTPSTSSISSSEVPCYYHPSSNDKCQPAKPYLSTEAGIRNFSQNVAPADGTPALADAPMQRSMTMTYAVAPQGSITLLVAPASVANLCAMVPPKMYKRFQINRTLERITTMHSRPSQSHPSGLSSFGQHVGKFMKTGLEKAKPLQTVINSVQPIRPVFQEHSTWKITMLGVLDIFESKRHGWNRSYPAAQRIFQGPSSVVAKQIVKLQHTYLYGGAVSVKALQNLREDLQEVRGSILDGKDFCEVLNYGHRRGKPRLFTYVLMPTKLYLAETGAEFFRDMMSKHAMHCSASPEVVYAGELQFVVTGYGTNNPKAKLIVDNNSGTYTPGKEDLPKVAEVFHRNFPGLEVQALDFRDPYLSTLSAQLPPTNLQEETIY